MPALSLAPGDVESLIAQIRGLQARDAGAEAAPEAEIEEDGTGDEPENTHSDLSPAELRASFREQVRELDERQQDELVALLWLGRGDVEADEWEDAVRMARERRDTPTEDYLLSQPLVAEHWAEGAAQLGLDVLPEREFGSIQG